MNDKVKEIIANVENEKDDKKIMMIKTNASSASTSRVSLRKMRLRKDQMIRLG